MKKGEDSVILSFVIKEVEMEGFIVLCFLLRYRMLY